jgi:hypothetical protein
MERAHGMTSVKGTSKTNVARYRVAIPWNGGLVNSGATVKTTTKPRVGWQGEQWRSSRQMRRNSDTVVRSEQRLLPRHRVREV